MSKTPGPNSAIQSEKELFIATSVLKRRITATFSKQVRLFETSEVISTELSQEQENLDSCVVETV